MTVSLVGRMAIGRSSSLCPDLVTHATCRAQSMVQTNKLGSDGHHAYIKFHIVLIHANMKMHASAQLLKWSARASLLILTDLPSKFRNADLHGSDSKHPSFLIGINGPPQQQSLPHDPSLCSAHSL